MLQVIYINVTLLAYKLVHKYTQLIQTTALMRILKATFEAAADI